MPPIERVDAKKCVNKALSVIADFNPQSDIETFTFAQWHDFHKSVFLNAVALCISKKGSRITLNMEMLNDYATLGDFINMVYEDSSYLEEPEDKLDLT